MIEVIDHGMVICDHVTSECIKDGCHHAKAHEWRKECRQVYCNSAKGMPHVNLMVKCNPVGKK